MTRTDLSFSCETYMRATPDRVWQAFTDGDLAAHASSGRGFSRAGRGDQIAHVGPDGTTQMAEGTIAEADPGRLGVYRARLLCDLKVAMDAPVRLTGRSPRSARYPSSCSRTTSSPDR